MDIAVVGCAVSLELDAEGHVTAARVGLGAVAPTALLVPAAAEALIGQGDGVNLMIAWAYVGLRVIHSIFQSTVNKVAPRFALFALSSVALMALVLHAAMAVFSL